MNIDYIHAENMGKRFIRKDFKCLSCFRIFKKLVKILITQIQCPFCYSDNCQEISYAKDNNNNSEIDNCSLKTNITLKDDEPQFNNDNNIYNNSPLENNQIYNNNNSIFLKEKEKPKNSFLCKKKLLENIKPFSKSPFSKSVNRHKFDINDILEDGIPPTLSEDFFLDNYASNFVSNFDNPLGRIIFIQMQINNNSKIKTLNPLNLKEIKQIQNFEMNENFCKKVNNEYELPNCIFCLKDILLESNCFLLICGHLMHDKCFHEWIKEHRICPVCKFYLVKKGSVRKSSLDLIIDDTIKEEEKIEKIFPEKKDDIDMNNSYDISKYIDDVDSNINIIGEKISEMELYFAEK